MRLIPCLPMGLSHTLCSSFLPKGLARHLATQTLVMAINNPLHAATLRCSLTPARASGMNPLLGTRARKSRGLFTHRGAGLWHTRSCPYHAFSPQLQSARLARANPTLNSDRGETSWGRHGPEWRHYGLACGLPVLQSPGCSRRAGLYPAPCAQRPPPSRGRANWERRRSGLCITQNVQSQPQILLWEPSPLSHPPGPSPSHLSPRGHDDQPPPPAPHVPLQQGLPEGREDTVIVVPGGRQVGPARVGGVQAPCSLPCEGREGGTRHQRSLSAPHQPSALRGPSPWVSGRRPRARGQFQFHSHWQGQTETEAQRERTCPRRGAGVQGKSWALSSGRRGFQARLCPLVTWANEVKLQSPTSLICELDTILLT